MKNTSFRKIALLISLIMVVVLTTCLFVSCNKDSAEEDNKTVVKISITGSQQVKLSQFSMDNYKILVTYDDGSTSEVPLTKDYMAADDYRTLETQSGQHLIPIKYKDTTCNWYIDIVNDKTYTITWANWDGTVLEVDEDLAYHANPFYDGETPVRESEEGKIYIFSGWDSEKCLVNEDKTYTAVYTELEAYSITYNLDGGENNLDNPVYYTVQDMVILKEPTKDGYEFLGWTGSGISKPQKEVTLIKGTTDNRTYIANWSLITYTIEYNLNGGKVKGDNPGTYTVETEDFTIINPTKDEYNFTGWTGTGLESATETLTIKKGTSGDLELTANYKAMDYLIYYNLAGGTNNPSNPDSYTIEDRVEILEPTREYYTFMGWVVIDQEGTVLKPVIEVGNTTDMAFTATWTPIKYTITYNLYGGTNNEDNPSEYTVEDDVEIKAPTKGTDIFLGWAEVTESGVSDYKSSITIPSGSYGNRTYNAIWNGSQYNIEYNLNDGVNNPLNVLFYSVGVGATIYEPTRDGYTFTGWTGTGLTELTKVITISPSSAEDKVYTANWVKNE